jgi:hypothetical protein
VLVKPAPSIRGLIWQCTLLLRAASLLVPKAKRRDWYQEWYAEIWHWAHFLHESGRMSGAAKLELARHCWGAFPDAAWHRFNQDRFLRDVDEVPRSARFCLGAISAALLLVFLVSGLAPTIRSSLAPRPLPYAQPERIAQVSFPGNFNRYRESVIFYSAAQWAQRSRTAKAVAAYSFGEVQLRVESENFPGMTARVSPNFFELLGVKPALGRLFKPGDERDCNQCAVVSQQFWKTRLRGDAGVVGKNIKFGRAQKEVIGVLPANFAFVRPDVSVWALPPAEYDGAIVVDHTGAVLRLADGASLAQAAREFQDFVGHDNLAFNYANPEVELIAARSHLIVKVYLLFTALSLLGALALASTRLAAARTGKSKLSVRSILRWWSFLTLKTLLLLSFCLVLSLELTGRLSIWFTGSIEPMVGPVSTWLFLVTGMIALSWSIHDQCRRCRVCLKRLGNEASVGAPSYLLLDWWGTELVCSEGHGLLHVPEMKSSWLEIEQWVRLDESWKPLFESDKAVRPARVL